VIWFEGLVDAFGGALGRVDGGEDVVDFGFAGEVGFVVDGFGFVVDFGFVDDFDFGDDFGFVDSGLF
jgi:hypothetical protein